MPQKRLVLFEMRRPSAAEGLVQNTKTFQTRVERLMTSLDSFFEHLYLVRIKAVLSRNLVRVSNITLIPDGSFSRLVRFREYLFIILAHAK
jgi:hypothetical protein